jgi:hypothetical protein
MWNEVVFSKLLIKQNPDGGMKYFLKIIFVEFSF